MEYIIDILSESEENMIKELEELRLDQLLAIRNISDYYIIKILTYNIDKILPKKIQKDLPEIYAEISGIPSDPYEKSLYNFVDKMIVWSTYGNNINKEAFNTIYIHGKNNPERNVQEYRNNLITKLKNTFKLFNLYPLYEEYITYMDSNRSEKIDQYPNFKKLVEPDDDLFTIIEDFPLNIIEMVAEALFPNISNYIQVSPDYNKLINDFMYIVEMDYRKNIHQKYPDKEKIYYISDLNTSPYIHKKVEIILPPHLSGEKELNTQLKKTTLSEFYKYFDVGSLLN